MAKIKPYYTKRCSYIVHNYYLSKKPKGGDDCKGYKSIEHDQFWDESNFENIKTQIENHVYGSHDGSLQLEKICQQWIINNNNNNEKSDWYFVDTEYVYKGKGEKKTHPFGRADLIAISKKPIAHTNNIHDVAFIELKLGCKAYKTSNKSSNVSSQNPLNLDELPEDYELKLGSGLASHIADYIRFFNTEHYATDTREEIINLLDIHKKFGLLDKDGLNEISSLNSIDRLVSEPKIYIVTYSNLPNFDETRIKDKNPRNNYINMIKDIPTIKQKFYEWMFSNDLSVTKILAGKHIDEIKSKEGSFNSTCEEPLEIPINKKKYSLCFRFVDVSSNIEPWRCI